MKRRPLKRGTSQLQRKTPLRWKPKLQSVESRKAYENVRRRSGGQCEAGQTGVCKGRATDVHHIVLRSRGGDDSESNLLHTCRACHSFIHMNPAIATENGWMRHAWDLEPTAS